MKIKDELIKLAIDNPGFGKAKFAAAILQGGQVLGYGFNLSKSHPLQAKFSRNEYSIFLHAEIDAIRNSLRRSSDLNGSTLYIARVWKDGRLALAKPCEGCQEALHEYGIAYSIWTTSEGWSDEIRTSYGFREGIKSTQRSSKEVLHNPA